MSKRLGPEHSRPLPVVFVLAAFSAVFLVPDRAGAPNTRLLACCAEKQTAGQGRILHNHMGAKLVYYQTGCLTENILHIVYRERPSLCLAEKINYLHILKHNPICLPCLALPGIKRFRRDTLPQINCLPNP